MPRMKLSLLRAMGGWKGLIAPTVTIYTEVPHWDRTRNECFRGIVGVADR